MKKMRKYAQGGGVGDDVRARAMRFIQGETELSGKYHGDADPLAGVIKAAEARDKARTRAKSSPVAQRLIEEGRRLAARDYQGIEPAWGISGFKAGGKVDSASKRADGIAQRGKTRGKVC